MKNTFLLIFFFLTIQVVCGQQNEIDSLKNIIKKQRRDTPEMKAIMKLVNMYFDQSQLDSVKVYVHQGLLLAKSLDASIPKDSSRVIWLIRVSGVYRFEKPDSCIIFAKEALDLSHKLNFEKGECEASISLGESFRLIGDFPQALELLFNALRISRDIGYPEMEENGLSFIGIAYVDLGDHRQGLNYLYQAKKMGDQFHRNRIKGLDAFRLSYIGQAYEKMNMPDSALFFEQQALSSQQQDQDSGYDVPLSPLKSLILIHLGAIQASLGNQTQALSYLREAIHIGDILNLGTAQYHIAKLFYTRNQLDSGMYYARLAFTNSQRSLEKIGVLESCSLLAKLYRATGKLDSAFHYQDVAMIMKDSLFSADKFHKLQLLAINEQQQQKEIQQEKERFENKIKMVALVATIGVFLLVAIMLYRNNRQKQKANSLLEYQKHEIQNALSELKSTQAQLTQQEKMASLGELTAGIAHEIQNPLNFVNNFSEVNKEMIDEATEEIDKGNIIEVKNILNDLKDNEEKILRHGKRADAIVKGMLQHSRESTGKKEPTDINALCDEYLRLSYHGMRAKDKTFNAALQKDFDTTIGKINIVPQDIGRVLLNLFNNAFYAVSEKKRLLADSYQPIATVSTKKINGKVVIYVKDNGVGIPQKIIGKIFQPFFTTKPTGQGTGLGLSLSYDIIKVHGGEIKVEAKEGEGSEFIIQLSNV